MNALNKITTGEPSFSAAMSCPFDIKIKANKWEPKGIPTP